MSKKFEKLTENRVKEELESLPEWTLENGALKREFKFKNFVEAFGFLSQVAILAEKLNHHPDIFSSYNTVIISGLCTHDADDAITTLDIELAKQISKL